MLIFTGILNSVLFLCAASIGLHTVIVSLFLMTQTAVVWCILNNHRIGVLKFLEATDFMMGIAVGITIGGTVLSVITSSWYKSLTPSCKTSGQNADYDRAYESVYDCHSWQTRMTGVWFWAGLVFWSNICTAMLLTIGRRELTNGRGNYEPVGAQEDGTAEQVGSRGMYNEGGNDFLGGLGVPSFVGNYSSVPEIRTDVQESVTNSNSETARITSL
jgi:hypothetical protein